MLEFTSFIVLIFLLSYFRSQIAFLIQGISLLLFNTAKPGIIFYSILFLPGVLIHELSHLLTAELLGIQTGKINIFPSEIKEGNTKGTFGTGGGFAIKMGYVESEATDPFRETLIGSAPFVVGLLIITFTSLFRFSNLDIFATSRDFFKPLNLLFLYFIFTISNTMFVSEEDKRGWWFIPMIFVIITAFFYGFRIPLNLEGLLIAIVSKVQFINHALTICLGLDVFFLIALNLTRRITEKLTGKRLLSKNS